LYGAFNHQAVAKNSSGGHAIRNFVEGRVHDVGDSQLRIPVQYKDLPELIQSIGSQAQGNIASKHGSASIDLIG
jgi:hypothetical protein